MHRLSVLLLALLVGCPAPRGDDDDATGYQPADDDDATGDDDDATGDDDDATGDDDDATGDDDDATGDDDDSSPAVLTDFSATGPNAVTSSDANLGSGASCAMDYTLFEPTGVANAPLVILAHGFQRGRAQMAVLGEHLASWGLRVATPQLCHSSILDTNHELNGDDMVALADALAGSADVAYAGYSAGGLSALVAASGDPDTVALVGLDLVDSGSIGNTYAGSVTAYAHNLVGTSNMCNSSNNGLPIIGTIPGALQARVTDADHCDFEDPTDWLCQLGCPAGSNTAFSDDDIKATVRSLATSALLWRFGLDASGADWWPGGSGWSTLTTSGAASIP